MVSEKIMTYASGTLSNADNTERHAVRWECFCRFFSGIRNELDVCHFRLVALYGGTCRGIQ